MASRDKLQQNSPDFYQNQSDREGKRFAWEPYAISSPRILLTEEELNEQKRQRKIDQDFVNAYLTYSPYRTLNQEYGAARPTIHFIDREQAMLNQATMDTSIEKTKPMPNLRRKPSPLVPRPSFR